MNTFEQGFPILPIGYVAPPAGTKLALGLVALVESDPQPGPLAGVPLQDPRSDPTTRTAAEGQVTAGRGQAPNPPTFALLRGLNAT